MLKFAQRLHGLTASKSEGQAALVAQLTATGRRITDLSLGELRVAPPTELLEALGNALNRPSNLYTDTIGLRDLREQVAARIAAASGHPWTADNIVLTAGAKQALFNIAAALFEPGDDILIPSPYWTTFPAQAQLVGARALRVDLGPYGFAPVVEAVEAAWTPATRALLLNSPNNPSGQVYTREEWLALFEFAKRSGLIVIIDECYKDYCFPRNRYVSPAPLWDGPEEHLIIVDSFSKSLSLTGWRLGYLAAHPKVIASVRTVQNHTTSNPSSLIQHAMSIALQRTDFRAFIDARWADLDRNRRIVLEGIEFIRRDPARAPGGGFFFYVPTASMTGEGREWSDINAVCNAILRDTGVLVVPGSAFGDQCGFRMSFCGDSASLSDGVRALDAFIRTRGL